MPAREQTLFSGQECNLQEVRTGHRRCPFAKTSLRTQSLPRRALGSSTRRGVQLRVADVTPGHFAVDAVKGTKPALLACAMCPSLLRPKNLLEPGRVVEFLGTRLTICQVD